MMHVVAILIDSISQAVVSPALAMQMDTIGDSAVPGWSMTLPTSDNIYKTVAMRFIQLAGMVGILKGSTGVIRFSSPEQHPKKPPTLIAPLAQLLFGMLGLVPETVILMAEDLITRFGF